jgi:hypothetical protein
MLNCDQIEQDTKDDEDIPNIIEMICPELHSCISQFCMSYNRSIFDGWVKQPSACCGAAAVAGAWNSFYNKHRSDSFATNHEDVLNVQWFKVICFISFFNYLTT